MKSLKRLYATTPQQWVNKIRTIIHKKKFYSNNYTYKKIDNLYINKNIAKILTEDYYALRNPLIQSIINQILKKERFDLDCFVGVSCDNFDERLIEYPYVINWLNSSGEYYSLADVGSVLNNKLVSTYLSSRLDIVSFINPALEEKQIKSKSIFYPIDISHSGKHGFMFDRITCLSTIEHIGYDNSHHDSQEAPIYSEPNDQPLVDSIESMIRMLNPRGKMLVSVPYGLRLVNLHPITMKIASQVFDYNSIIKLKRIIEQQDYVAKFKAFEIIEGRWQSVTFETCNAVYAEDVPAAKAVIFIEIERLNS